MYSKPHIMEFLNSEHQSLSFLLTAPRSMFQWKLDLEQGSLTPEEPAFLTITVGAFTGAVLIPVIQSISVEIVEKERTTPWATQKVSTSLSWEAGGPLPLSSLTRASSLRLVTPPLASSVRGLSRTSPLPSSVHQPRRTMARCHRPHDLRVVLEVLDARNGGKKMEVVEESVPVPVLGVRALFEELPPPSEPLPGASSDDASHDTKLPPAAL
ncbi:hypothetical protein DFJ73DRAFT_826247 [Zopfochytrium polystomum]|nr:hypothetical protein DFJ73DRAFT_826247 [Zopfochytrium polystomum]